MLDMMLQILAVLGIILLVLLTVFLTIVFLVLFFPVTYRIYGKKDEDGIRCSAKAKWLFGLLRARYSYPERGHLTIKALCFTLYDAAIPGDSVPKEEQTSGGTEKKKTHRAKKTKKETNTTKEKKATREKKAIKEKKVPREKKETKEKKVTKEKNTIVTESAVEEGIRTDSKRTDGMKTGTPKADSIEGVPQIAEGIENDIKSTDGIAGAPKSTEGIETDGKITDGIAANGKKADDIETTGIDTTGIETTGINTTGIETTGIDTTKKDTTDIDTVGDANSAGAEKVAEALDSSEENIRTEGIGKIFLKFRKIKYTICRIYDKIKKIWKNISYYIELLKEEETKQLFQYSLFRIGKIWKHIRPRHIKADILFGTGSPDTTGYLYGAYCIVSSVMEMGILVTPDFEQAVFQGEVDVSGHITIWVLVWNGCKLFLDKKLRKFLKKLKV